METVEYIEIPSNEKIMYGNALIAGFDGFAQNIDTGAFEDQSAAQRPSRTSFTYHESWEALMPVLKKIAEADKIYCDGVAEILRKNKFEILPVWSSVVKHMEFLNRKNNDHNS